jgi:hypothetical protein
LSKYSPMACSALLLFPFRRNITSDSGILGSKLRKVSISARDCWEKLGDGRYLSTGFDYI